MRLQEGFFFALICGFFIALFLIVYQPFGTYEFSSESKYLFLSGYGLIVFVVMFFIWLGVQSVIQPALSRAHWIAIATVVFSFVIALIVSFVYKQWYFQAPLSLSTLLDYLPFGLATGLIPISLVIWLKLRPGYLPLSEHIVLMDTNGKDILKLNPSDLLFIKASDNYIEVHYQKNTESESTLLRNTLSVAESRLNHLPYLMRCHRSYLVNLHKVKKATGNKDRLMLLLDEDLSIPVSRKQADTLLQKLRHS